MCNIDEAFAKQFQNGDKGHGDPAPALLRAEQLDEFDEAAVIDGSGPWQLFSRVIFPLLKPVSITVLVLNFMGAWNDFISPLYLLNRQSTWPMVMSVYNFFGMHFNEWNMISAVILLSTLPILVLYLLGQRYIVSGLTSGAVKQ